MKTLNINVGMFGHVDCGKTSLCKVLSTCESVGCFDRDPQSQERGITLDLGFSSFVVEHLPQSFSQEYDRIRFTLVDCPGHASLIRTIIGGAQIIDMMILVIDAVQGVQTQTGECIVIGEIACNKRLIVAINKVDIVDKEMVDKLEKRLKQTIQMHSKFDEVRLIRVSAKNGQVESLKNALIDSAYVPQRNSQDPFLFYIKQEFTDHSFSSKGKGIILTGTVISGKVHTGSLINLPHTDSPKEQYKIRSIQVFHETVSMISQGDRAGIALHLKRSILNVDRGLACVGDTVNRYGSMVIRAFVVKYFKYPLKVNHKYHLTVAYSTTLCQIAAIYCCDEDTAESVLCPENALVIGSKLDLDIHANVCRIAFHGNLFKGYRKTNENPFQELNIYKEYEKSGIVERIYSETSLIGCNIFSNHESAIAFTGMKVVLANGRIAIIESTFGQKGKVVLRLMEETTNENMKKMEFSLKYKKYQHARTLIRNVFQT